MASIAQFSLPPGEFPLGRVFDARPDAVLELDRVVPSGDTVMPYFWVHSAGADLEAVTRVFAALEELRSVALIEDLGDSGLFRATWAPEYLGIMAAIEAAGVTVLSASGSREGWTFEIRATSPGQLGAFQSHCDDLGVEVTLERLVRLTDDESGTDAFGLTPRQRETVRLAYEMGYYEEPRRTDLASIAEELGVSRQAVSARLRRAYRNLLAATVIAEQSAPE